MTIVTPAPIGDVREEKVIEQISRRETKNIFKKVLTIPHKYAIIARS